MIIYLDTSALLKRYIQESGSQEVAQLLASVEAAGTSLLTYAEMASAFSRAVRMKIISAEEAQATWEDFLLDWDRLVRLEISGPLTKRAAVLAWEHGLRGYDALHFASALTWQEAVETPVTLATYDRELWSAAQQAGMGVWPE